MGTPDWLQERVPLKGQLFRARYKVIGMMGVSPEFRSLTPPVIDLDYSENLSLAARFLGRSSVTLFLRAVLRVRIPLVPLAVLMAGLN